MKQTNETIHQKNISTIIMSPLKTFYYDYIIVKIYLSLLLYNLLLAVIFTILPTRG